MIVNILTTYVYHIGLICLLSKIATSDGGTYIVAV